MIVATWNVNGVRARTEAVLAWFAERRPDVACLQEIKTQDEGFPRAAFAEMGYHVETHGQKGFNGVALLSLAPPEEGSVRRGLPGGEGDEQSRYIEAVWRAENGRPLRVASLYLPNGNPVGTEKYPYKLAWMERLERHAVDLLARHEPLVLAGDYNVIPEAVDAKHPEAWAEDALFRPETRRAFRRLLNLGFTEALRASTDADATYSFWDYQAGAWPKNNGIRIDHLLLSPEAASRLSSAGIDRHVRAWEKPSDHVPVVIDLDA